MSAYICDKNHITYLVHAAKSRRLNRHYGPLSWYHDNQHHELKEHDWDRACEVGTMLWMENIKSVSHRYPNESGATLPGPIGESYKLTARSFRVWRGHVPDPVQALKSISCLDYQSCEHPGWKDSEAHAFLRSLKSMAIDALPGYNEAAWGAPAPATQLQV